MLYCLSIIQPINATCRIIKNHHGNKKEIISNNLSNWQVTVIINYIYHAIVQNGCTVIFYNYPFSRVGVGPDSHLRVWRRKRFTAIKRLYITSTYDHRTFYPFCNVLLERFGWRFLATNRFLKLFIYLCKEQIAHIRICWNIV